MIAMDAQEIHLRCIKMKQEARVQKLYVEIGSRSVLKERLEDMVADVIMERWEHDNRVPGEWEIKEAFRKLEPNKIHDMLTLAWDTLDGRIKEELTTDLTDSFDELLRDAVEERILEERSKEPESGKKRRKGKRIPRLPG